MNPRLSVNLNPICELRGIQSSEIIKAANLAESSGAEVIRIQLGESEERIGLEEIRSLRAQLRAQLHLKIAPTPKLIRVATQTRPHWVSLMSLKGGTIQGGKECKTLEKAILTLKKAKIGVMGWIEPNPKGIGLLNQLGCQGVELCTQSYSLASQKRKGKPVKELGQLLAAAELAQKSGLKVHGGGGLNYKNIRNLIELETSKGEPLIEVFQVGHALFQRAILVGLDRAVREMVSAVLAP